MRSIYAINSIDALAGRGEMARDSIVARVGER